MVFPMWSKSRVRLHVLRCLIFLNCVVFVLNLFHYFVLNTQQSTPIERQEPPSVQSTTHPPPPTTHHHHSTDAEKAAAAAAAAGTQWPPAVFAPIDAHDVHLLDLSFRVFVEAVEAAGLQYFIVGGTLIGSLRHHGPIPWDDDVDVMLNVTDKARLHGVLSQLSPEFQLYSPPGDSYNPQWKFFSSAGRDTVFEFRSPFIDIFFFHEDGTRIWNESPQFNDTDAWPKKVIFPLVRRPFGDLSVLAPCNGPAAVGIDLSVCESRFYSHIFDVDESSSLVALPCHMLSYIYPFVKREEVTGGENETDILFKETLLLGNWNLREITLEPFC